MKIPLIALLGLFGLFALSNARPAFACDPGPYPILFENNATKLSAGSKHLLNGIAEYFNGGNKRQLIKWYGPTANHAARIRSAAVVAYLAARGMPRFRLVVAHAKGQPPILWTDQRRVRASVTIETIEGGCAS